MAAKTRILGIVPYEGLRTIMLKVAEQRTDVTLDVYIGDMQEGADIARFHENEGYDVIISRGAVMRLIKAAVNIPVVSVDFSAYDILRAMKLAENYPHRYAIVGFPTVTKPARVLCDMLQKNIDIVTVYREEDTRAAMRDLKNRGFSMVIGGTLATRYANEAGLSGIFITSGEESVEEAFDQAVEMSRGYAEMKERRLLYEKIIEQGEGSVLVFDSKKKLCFSTWNSAKYGKMKSLLSEEIDEVPAEGCKKLRVFDDTLFAVYGSRIDVWGSTYTLFRLQEEKIPASSNRYGLFFVSKKEAENSFYNSFYGASGALGLLEDKINVLIKNSFPVMIVGERGTGKDPIATYIYMKSLLSNNTLMIMDCELISDKSWAYVLNGAGSPLGESNNIFYIKNLDSLSESKYHQLLSVIQVRNLHRRNRIIFSSVKDREGRVSEKAERFINQFSCMTLYLPSLRERKEELPVLANLYIGKMNQELAKQIIGFEPGAAELLQEFGWTYNFTQLKRVLDELAAVTDTPYISLYNVKKILEREREGTGNKVSEEKFDFDRTLDEMNRDIIRRELERMNGNQSAAAKKLGISRTTLWRYLKQ